MRPGPTADSAATDGGCLSFPHARIIQRQTNKKCTEEVGVQYIFQSPTTIHVFSCHGTYLYGRQKYTKQLPPAQKCTDLYFLFSNYRKDTHYLRFHCRAKKKYTKHLRQQRSVQSVSFIFKVLTLVGNKHGRQFAPGLISWPATEVCKRAVRIIFFAKVSH